MQMAIVPTLQEATSVLANRDIRVTAGLVAQVKRPSLQLFSLLLLL
jgi:hypothetical protein